LLWALLLLLAIKTLPLDLEQILCKLVATLAALLTTFETFLTIGLALCTAFFTDFLTFLNFFLNPKFLLYYPSSSTSSKISSSEAAKVLLELFKFFKEQLILV